jgi:hypothetical protein
MKTRLLALCAFAACTSAPSTQVITGHIDTTKGALAVRAIADGEVVTAATVRSDGSFTIAVPAGKQYRLEVLTRTGLKSFVTRSSSGLHDVAFRVCHPVDPFDCGGVGDPGMPPKCDPSDPTCMCTPDGTCCSANDPNCTYPPPPPPCMDPNDPGCPPPPCMDPTDPNCQPPPPCDPTTDPLCKCNADGTCCGPNDPNCPPPPCMDPTDPNCQPPPCDPATDPMCGCNADGTCCGPDDPNCPPPPPCMDPSDPNCQPPPCDPTTDPMCKCDANGNCGPGCYPDGTCPPPPCMDPSDPGCAPPCEDPMDPTTCKDPCANDPTTCGCSMDDPNCWPQPQPCCDANGTCDPSMGMQPDKAPADFGCE